MKVLLANKFFYVNGGSEAVMFHERDFLRTAGVDVVDFSMKDPRNRPSPFAESFVGNQSYERVSGGAKQSEARTALRLIHSSEAVRKIGKLIEETRPDLVHCHNIYHQLTPSIIGAAKRRGVPVVLTLHDYKPICPVYVRLRNGQTCSECLEHGFSRVVINRCANGSLTKSALLYAEALVQKLLGSYESLDAVIAPSVFMQTSVVGRFLPEQITVIHNGVDTRSIQPSDEDENYILYMGRLSSEKGVETFLDAQRGLGARLPMVVAGTGPLEGELRARYPNVRFLGHLAGEELKRIIRQASLVVVPSKWFENCPMSVLESMAYGKAVVASAIGGIPELVVHGETGLLFRAGDAGELQGHLLKLMESPALRRAFGFAGRKRAEELFSQERHNTALMGLYERVVRGSKGLETTPIVDRTGI